MASLAVSSTPQIDPLYPHSSFASSPTMSSEMSSYYPKEVTWSFTRYKHLLPTANPDWEEQAQLMVLWGGGVGKTHSE